MLFGLLVILCTMIPFESESLDFEKVKFNTPEKVVAELGIKGLPKMTYVKNTTNSETSWGNWDCLVEFQFEDSL